MLRHEQCEMMKQFEINNEEEVDVTLTVTGLSQSGADVTV